jgi:hypothetical protein
VLQRFHEKHPEVSVITIACDVTGPGYPMRYLRKAKASFEMWIDATCVVSRRWGLKRVGVPLLLDEAGCLLKLGEKLDEAFLAEAEGLLSRPAARTSAPETRVDTKNTQIEIHMQSCGNLLTRQRTDDAVAALRKALGADPENRIIPKQVWVLRNPEKFYSGPIDKEWQAQQPPVTP